MQRFFSNCSVGATVEGGMNNGFRKMRQGMGSHLADCRLCTVRRKHSVGGFVCTCVLRFIRGGRVRDTVSITMQECLSRRFSDPFSPERVAAFAFLAKIHKA